MNPLAISSTYDMVPQKPKLSEKIRTKGRRTRIYSRKSDIESQGRRMREMLRSMYDRYRGKPWRGDNPSYAKGALESTQCHTTSICLFTCLIPVQNASIVKIVVRAPSFPVPSFLDPSPLFSISPFLHLRISHQHRTCTLRMSN